ncbi:MAG: AraC family transcriptional regulator [Clostridia bacterium]
MDYSILNREEYKGSPIVRIADNKNDLPFFIARRNQLNPEKHRHEFVQIIYVTKGSATHVINENRFEIFKGDIFIMPPYVPHYFIQDKEVEIIEYEFIPEFINEKFSSGYQDTGFMDFACLEPFLVAENKMKPRLNISGGDQMEIENIFNEIIREYRLRQHNFELVIKALTLKLLIFVSRRYPEKSTQGEGGHVFLRHKDCLLRALEYIHGNYDKDISLDDVVRVSLLSKSYFGYLFKHMTNKTFTEYVNSLRIAKAVELLRTRHDLMVVDICFEVGYNNVNHFNRIFKTETGLTPMKVRKKKN